MYVCCSVCILAGKMHELILLYSSLANTEKSACDSRTFQSKVRILHRVNLHLYHIFSLQRWYHLIHSVKTSVEVSFLNRCKTLLMAEIWYAIIEILPERKGPLLMEVTTVSFDLINRIFLFINRTENQAILLSHRQKWYRLTSSLRVLEDTSWAIEYYLLSQYPTDHKGKCLYTYGLLQALFLQMDAANSLNQALFEKKINYKDEYPAAYAIREIRNDVTGHPTN